MDRTPLDRPAPTAADPLTSVVLDIERHEADRGWDEPPRVYALAASARLLEREPELAAQLGLADGSSPLTAIEQGELPWEGSLGESLARIAWPETVDGAALVTVLLHEDVRMTPREGEDVEVVAQDEMRVVVAVLRDGRAMCALRFRSHDDERSVLTGATLAPDLVDAVGATFE